MEDEGVLLVRGGTIGDQEAGVAVRNPSPCPLPQGEGGFCCNGRADPAAVDLGRFDCEIDSIAGQQRSRDRFRGFRVRRPPSCWRVVEGEAEADVAGGGDGGDAAGDRGDPARQVIGAVMAAEQRHGDAAVFGDGDDRRLGALVGEQRRQAADDDAAGADGDDGLAGSEETAQVLADVVEADGGIRDPGREAVQRGVRQGRHEALRQGKAAWSEDNDGDHRDGTRIMEK
jgi:hypothetical protein